jgi:amino acid transporter
LLTVSRENANYVLSEVKRPRGHESRTFKRGVLFAFCLVSTLYLLGNVAYFAASSVYDIEKASINVAAEFFGNVFGQGSFVKRGLRVFIALSAFGNLIATTYAHSRVEQEFAKQRILPFSKYWARNSPYGTPVGALTLHWAFTVILILATPNDKNGEAYGLVGNLFVYGQAWVAVFIAIGLATLRYHNKYREWKPAVIKNFKLLYFLAAFYVVFNLFIIVLIWWPAPANLKLTISSYVTPGVSTCLLAFGVLYWFCFAKVLPVLGYEIDDEPEELADGTRVVTYKVRPTYLRSDLTADFGGSVTRLGLRSGWTSGGQLALGAGSVPGRNILERIWSDERAYLFDFFL